MWLRPHIPRPGHMTPGFTVVHLLAYSRALYSMCFFWLSIQYCTVLITVTFAAMANVTVFGTVQYYYLVLGTFRVQCCTVPKTVTFAITANVTVMRTVQHCTLYPKNGNPNS